MVKISLEAPSMSEDARKRARLERFASTSASALISAESSTRVNRGNVCLRRRSRSRSRVPESSHQGRFARGDDESPLSHERMCVRQDMVHAVPPLKSVHPGTVVSVMQYGAFVRLGNGRIYKDGLLPKVRWPRSEKHQDRSTLLMRQVDLQEGDKVYVKVVKHRGFDRFELDARFLSQADGKDDDPHDCKRDDDFDLRHPITKIVCTSFAFEKDSHDDTLRVPYAYLQPGHITTTHRDPDQKDMTVCQIQCPLGLRNRNNLMLRECKCAFAILDTIVRRWFGYSASEESMASKFIKTLIWSFLRSPSNIVLARDANIFTCSIQTGCHEIWPTADASTHVVEMQALLKGPTCATIRDTSLPFPGLPCHLARTWRFDNTAAGRTLWWTFQPSELGGLTDRIGLSRFPCWVKKRVGIRRIPAGRAAISTTSGWLAQVVDEGLMDANANEAPVLRICNIATGETFNEPCDSGQAIYHLVAHRSILIYAQSGPRDDGSQVKLMEVQLAPMSLRVLSEQQIFGPVCNLAVQSDRLALAKARHGAELYQVSSCTGLAEEPFLVLEGDFRDVALAHDVLVTLAHGLNIVQVWLIQEVVQCIWRLQMPSVWCISVMRPHHVLRMQWLAKLRRRFEREAQDKCMALPRALRARRRAACAKDVAARLAKDFSEELVAENNTQDHYEAEYMQSNDDATVDEPVVQISPEEAAQVQRAFWETAVQRLAQVGSTTSAFFSREQPPKEKRIVLLSFNRRPAELQHAILKSPLALSFLEKGIDIQPSWAGGATVLVEDFGPEALDNDSCTWNVAVSDADEPYVFEALQTLPYKIRPRLKPGIGRQLVPESSELFDVSDPEVDNAQLSTDDENVNVQNVSEPQEFEMRVDIVRTFIHVRSKSVSSTGSRPNTI